MGQSASFGRAVRSVRPVRAARSAPLLVVLVVAVVGFASPAFAALPSPTPLGSSLDSAAAGDGADAPSSSEPGFASSRGQAAAAVNQTVVEQGFENVQIVWTNIGFGAPLSADEGDATGDGHPELVIGTESGVIVADKHFATIYWETKLFEPVALVAFQDMDGELPLDVVAVTMLGHTVGLSGADGSLLWEGQVGTLQAAHLADVSGDDVRDVVVITSVGIVSALDGKSGNELWTADIRDAAQFAVDRIRSRGVLASAVGALNGDGVPDVVVVDKTHFGGIGVPYGSTFATVYAYDGANGAPLWTARVHDELAAHALAKDVAIGDVNADGLNDVVVGGEYDHGIAKMATTYCNPVVCVPSAMPPEAPRFRGGFLTALDGSVAAQGTTPAHEAAALPLWSAQLNRVRISAVGFAGDQLLVGTSYGEVLSVVDGAPTGTAINVSHEQHPARIKDIRSLPKGDALVVTDYFFVRAGAGPVAKATFDPPGTFAPVSMTVVGDEASFLAAVEDARVYHLTPSFEVEATTKTYGKGSALGAADFTGDGIPDLVTGSLDGDLYLLNGRTGRRLANGTAPGPILADLALGKVNGDGKLDALAATTSGEVVAFDGRDLHRLWLTHVGDNVVAAKAGDFTGDGTTDLAVLLKLGSVSVVSGQDGAIAWTFEPSEGKVTAIAAGDFDGDGDDDLAVGQNGNGAIAALDGRTKAPLWSATGSQPVKALRGADLNGDGRDEIVAVLDRPSQGGNPQVLGYDKGAALWKIAVSEAGFIRGLGVATGRIDATSKGDDVLVCVSAEQFQDASGGRRATAEIPPPVHLAFGVHGEQGHLFWRAVLPEACGPVALGDLNQDGWSEAILSYGSGIAALDGQTGALVMSYATNGRNRELLAVRLNGDRVPEILLASEDANVYALAFSDDVLFGDGEGGEGGRPTAVDKQFFDDAGKRGKRGFLPGFEAVLVLASLVGVVVTRLRRRPH